LKKRYDPANMFPHNQDLTGKTGSRATVVAANTGYDD
jgi:hypothetical protein